MNDVASTEKNLPQKSLAELKVEIKFHLGQMAGHAIEIGNLLIQAKEQVGHGNFGKWLEDNFNLTQQSANRFMRVAERFGKLNIDVQFQSTQLITMLALPEGEEEKFIAEKKAENNPVEEMTVKKLRDEVAKYKADYEQKKSEVENLFHDNENLKSEKKSLQEQLQNQKPIEKLPDDYEPMKETIANLQGKIAALEKQLKEKPIDIATEYPKDYEPMKKELARLLEKLSETTKRAEIFQKIDTVCLLWKDIFQSKYGGIMFADYEKIKPNRYNEFVGSINDFFKNNGI